MRCIRAEGDLHISWQRKTMLCRYVPDPVGCRGRGPVFSIFNSAEILIINQMDDNNQRKRMYSIIFFIDQSLKKLEEIMEIVYFGTVLDFQT